ncbi:NAD(P)/FAD-dependent oxidoreductase [Bartonella sp. HY761]|uniref:NAD(P)/FAD-dependent oxidoreductase n=1 Tax=Bartonella sp. HY761 TaxID=2979330 RepID=UPI0022035F04|nr:NAD(P)/FAD-dependent oxidoreductase [Bartonella sp. HY761]UXN05373.1 NAD(P)/FAD-dependent oxidoreductase [Bartonella sp. HY761]
MSDHRVVIVGGGFAGLSAAKAIKCPNTVITVIDQRNHHLFQPLLYQVATTILATSEIAWPIRHLLRKRKDITTYLGKVTAIDKEARQVSLSDGKQLPYDTLILATGARHAYFGKDEWEDIAPGLKDLEDATTIRRRMLVAFEKAEMEKDPKLREALLTFVIIGGGATGVELAGIIAELAHKTLPKEFRNIDTTKAKVLLVEAGSRVLPVFPEELSEYAKKTLEKMGVDVRTGKPVTECHEDGVAIGDEAIPARTIIWAAGVKASDAADWINTQKDRAGRAFVKDDLSVENHPEIFIIGDTASVKQINGNPVPGIAPAAKQQGEYVAKVINHRRKNLTPPPAFHYRHLGNLATIGRNSAVIDFGKIRLTGFLAWWIWGVAHIYFLIGAQSRLAVALNWLWLSISGRRSARLITQRETRRTDEQQM